MGTGSGSLQAVRFRFRKDGPARYLSHGDLVRLFERAFRRAGFDLAFTEGFNPRPRLRIRPAIALGVPARGAAAEVILAKVPELQQMTEDLDRMMPEGLAFTRTSLLPVRRSSPMSRVVWKFPPCCRTEASGEAASDGPVWSAENRDDLGLFVTVVPAPGREPPGARFLAGLYCGENDPERVLLDTEMVEVEFQDGL